MAARSITLAFHGIGAPPATIPADERPYWIPADLFRSFAAGARAKARALGVDLLATFDDGNCSDLEIAAPLLAKHGVPAIFFPCTGRLDKAGYLGERELRQLAEMGFRIGSHGVDHVHWTELGAVELDREVAGSKDRLEQILGAKVECAAIPFGDYNRRVLGALKRAGYSKVYNSDRGLGHPEEWMTRRWTYDARQPFGLETFVALSNSLRRRATIGLKSLIKALR